MQTIKYHNYKFGTRSVVTKFGISLLRKIGDKNKPLSNIKLITNSEFLWTIGKEDMKQFIIKMENEHQFIIKMENEHRYKKSRE